MFNKTTRYNKQATQQLLKAVVVHNLEDTLNAIKDGADVNAGGADGNTPLARTMKFPTERPEMFSIIKALLEAGANPNGNVGTGVSPLLFASTLTTKNKQVIIEALLNAGVDVNDENAIDAYGNTPLMNCFGLRYDIIKTLIAKTRDINVTNTEGRTALMLAIENSTRVNVVGVVELLIKSGADVNACDIWGDRPLHFATRYCPMFLGVCELLLDAGAEINAQNNNECTALDLIDDKYFDTIRYLAERGAEDGERRIEEILSHEIPVAERTPQEEIDGVHSELGISLSFGTIAKINIEGKTVSITFDDESSPKQFAEEVYNYSDLLLRVMLNGMRDNDVVNPFTAPTKVELRKEEKALREKIAKLTKSFNSNFSAKAKAKPKKKAKKPAKKSAKKAKAKAKKTKKK